MVWASLGFEARSVLVLRCRMQKGVRAQGLEGFRVQGLEGFRVQGVCTSLQKKGRSLKSGPELRVYFPELHSLHNRHCCPKTRQGGCRIAEKYSSEHEI